VNDLNGAMMKLLKEITPRPECVELFTEYLQDAYKERVVGLQGKKVKAEEEIQRLLDMRRILVEKNLIGIYSDEIFKEQNISIEDKIAKAQTLKSDATLEKYDINKLTSFMKGYLKDLEETYKDSTITQAKALIGSIFTNGLAWDYSGTLNHHISPIYQYIKTCDNPSVSFGVGSGSVLEPGLLVTASPNDPYALCKLAIYEIIASCNYVQISKKFSI